MCLVSNLYLLDPFGKIGQAQDIPAGDGFSKNCESPIFSVDTLERNASRGHGLLTSVAAGNNVLLVGTNKGWLIRHDFLQGNDSLGSSFRLTSLRNFAATFNDAITINVSRTWVWQTCQIQPATMK